MSEITVEFAKSLYARVKADTGASGVWTLLSGQFYEEGDSRIGTQYPYGKYEIVDVIPDDTFKEKYDALRLQIDIVSTSTSSLEIKNVYSAVKKLLDDCVMNVTGGVHKEMVRMTTTFSTEDVDTPGGTKVARLCQVDYEALIQITG
jgi:hypothetical protein